ncbi:hypothetical protein K1T71_000505 [Dendrolimus kikuchii]|uniref:Uncharacterized protein n=1 Tax=Dendrolimus kikuchii TaxID=765133 RepID=A0ACC1DJJ8_9NEOP|nr:hypothetical protein K1T71_000505 [Dendrolimus kikuchii]
MNQFNVSGSWRGGLLFAQQGVRMRVRRREWGAAWGRAHTKCARLEITRCISVESPRAAVLASASAGAHRDLPAPHYPLTIRNRPTSWWLDLGYNDLTSAK